MTWDELFMSMCYLVAMKSKEPSTKSGCVITTKDHVILSAGYNWLPRGIEVDPDENRLSRTNAEKYYWIEHAERNAVYNAARQGVSIAGGRLYVNWVPCADCARAIVSVGISEVVIHKEGQDAYSRVAGDHTAWEASQSRTLAMFDEAGVAWDIRSIKVAGELEVTFSGLNQTVREMLNG